MLYFFLVCTKATILSYPRKMFFPGRVTKLSFTTSSLSCFNSFLVPSAAVIKSSTILSTIDTQGGISCPSAALSSKSPPLTRTSVFSPSLRSTISQSKGSRWNEAGIGSPSVVALTGTGVGRRSARKIKLPSEIASSLPSDENVETSDPTGEGIVVEVAKSNKNEGAEEATHAILHL
ncbi:hypothetical protein KFK09_007118 [Dendrobium nobile]|uniref:Uncharacterized protein n=1 Tax=Dendrobium nobile TaxID=94219 RepID=A0A8T3BW79_DENNO|nr:hypothetical protein KFK09_007118 [Dendrobium nobile]